MKRSIQNWLTLIVMVGICLTLATSIYAAKTTDNLSAGDSGTANSISTVSAHSSKIGLPIVANGKRATPTLTPAATSTRTNTPAVTNTPTRTSTPAATAVAGAVVYPLKASANGRYLVDQNNVPFLVVGDSPQDMVNSVAQSDFDYYFGDRQAAGFNAAWVNILCSAYQQCNGINTFDGVAPFSTPGDISTPNDAYYTEIDHLLQSAANHGVMVILNPIDTCGWLPALESSGTTKGFNYGVYVGNRYKNFPNIVWMAGCDYSNWSDPSVDQYVLAVANGIKSVDSNHIHTIELDAPRTSLDDSRWATIIGLNWVYTYSPTYAEVLYGYNQSTVPAFLGEANYEFENNTGLNYGSPLTLRLQEYWTMLSGAAGQLYGNHYTWRYDTAWKSHLDTVGSQQMGYLGNLLKPRAWWSLVPDQNHTVVTAGYGTFNETLGAFTNNDYLTASRTPDGKLVIAYMPTIRTITVDMTKLSGSVTARWYDPTNGAYLAVSGSPFVNTGSRQFTPAGNNSGGDGDWVLVLEVN